MRRILAFTLHAAAASIMAWGWFCLHELPAGKHITTLTGGHFQFLTIQGLVGAWLCMIASLLCDLFPSIHFLCQIKRSFLMIALPLAFVVSTIYWSLFFLAPHLILQPSDDVEVTSSGTVPKLVRIPMEVDLALHASPIFTLLVDFFVFERKFTKVQVNKAAPVAVIAFAIWYSSLVEYCATFNGFFPYPFLTYSPFAIRIIIYTTVSGLALVCFRGFNALHF